MKKAKLLAVVIAVLAILAVFPFVTSAEEPTKNGWYNDKGYYEYFDYGEQYKNGEYWISESESYFRFDADGKMYNKEWYKDPETLVYYYYKAGGYRADNCILNIDGAYYGFDDSGVMLNNQEASIYNAEADDWDFIRAKKGGALYCKEWYKNEYGNWYYYTDKAVAAMGLTKVGSATYYFAGDGWMLENTTYYDEAEGCTYFADQNGHATRLNLNGWTLIGKDYFYCSNGEIVRNQIKKIGNANYYFEWNGVMLDDSAIGIWDEYSSEHTYIRAKKGGALYCGGWYQDEYDRYSYYGLNCYRVNDGLKTIGSGLFYFENGFAVQDSIIELYDGVYVADKNCVLTKRSTGWINHNSEFYYVLDNQLVRDTKIEISGKEYIFNYEGMMYSDRIQDYYDEESEFYCYYLLGKDGAVIKEPGWEDHNGEWYYINSDGTLYQGILELGSAKYALYPNLQYSTLDYFYEEEIDGFYLYWLMPDGNSQKVTSDGYYNTPYGRVLLENGKLFEGWKNVGGKFYYFDPTMFINDYFYIDDYVYYFDNAGVMKAKGWIAYGDSYLYADEYGRLTNGITTIANKTYLFEDYRLIYNGYTYSDGIYVSDENAIATKIKDNGWSNIKGNFYYAVDGNIQTGITYIYENDTDVCYYFDYESGRMLADCYQDGYYFDSYGRRFEGWKSIDGSWYYFNPNKYWDGIYTIDDIDYCFDESGKMLTSTTYYSWSMDMMYVIDAYGKIVDEYSVPDGIVYDNGSAYMYKNGETYEGWYGEHYFDDSGKMLINETVKVGDNHYYLDNHGKYIHNGWYQVYENLWIYADAYGALCYDEWLRLGNSWYYFTDYLMLNDGVYYIETEDRWGEFDEYGKFIKYVDEPDNELPTGKVNSWEKIDGKWYYYNSTGTMVIGTSLYLNGSWYQFDFTGAMISDSFQYNYSGYGESFYYYTASGARLEASNQWKKINGNWCYFNADSTVAIGWVDISGTKYYIGLDIDYGQAIEEIKIIPEMYTGYRLVDGKVYNFDASGALKGEYTGKGWFKLSNGDYVYFMDGKLLTDGIYNIGGSNYYFYEYGELATDTVIYFYEDGVSSYIYASASGAIYGTGWHNTADGWIYVDASGKLLTNGVYKIGGGVYFFDNIYWAS